MFGSTDTTSTLYNQGADWVGVLFSIYNGVAALAAFALPLLAKRIGNAKTHMLGLLAGAAGYGAILIIRDANLLILPMIGVGIAWASILTMPYVILTDVLPQKKLGIYIAFSTSSSCYRNCWSPRSWAVSSAPSSQPSRSGQWRLRPS